jgi:predicted phosphate transport protein (TIGR00153 family)
VSPAILPSFTWKAVPRITRARRGNIPNLRIFSRFLVIGEKRIFSEIAEIMKIAHEANQILKQILKESDLEKLTGENEQIAALEKRADGFAFTVRRDITDGAVNPTVLDNLLECVEVADSTVDDYHYLAREITRIARVEPEENRNRIPSLDSAFLDMLRLADQSISKILELLAEEDMTEMRKDRHEIENIEERGDDIKDDAFDELYRLTPGMRYINFAHYSEIIHKIDDILDACEDLADGVVTVVTSISK